MKRNTQILIIVIGALLTSCNPSIKLDSFKPIHHYEEIGNFHKWDSAFFDSDSNIMIIPILDTFQLHFEIIKNKNNTLIFSIGNIDTIGILSTKNKIVYFTPFEKDSTYKLFDFSAKIEDCWTIEYFGPLTYHTLKIIETKNIGDETIQKIKVTEIIPYPSSWTNITDFTVSSKFGIIEMDVHVGWNSGNIKIINAP